jgi:hypothetical protein
MIDLTFRMQNNLSAAAKEMERRAWELVLLAANITRTQAIALVSKPAQRIRKRRTRNTSRGKKGSQYTVFIGSRPGQPPMVRTSLGRRSVQLDPRRNLLLVRLGVLKNAEYMGMLEVGTRRVAARPWLRAALDRVRPTLATLRLKG